VASLLHDRDPSSVERRRVFSFDDAIANGGHDPVPLAVVAVAFLLGLRHASDPDHLVAVSTLIATEPERCVRRAANLGLCWGLGHASTLLVLGFPVVFVGDALPDLARRAAEAVVGEERHVHEHAHERPALVRSPLQAYAIGLVHGVAGSAAVGILLVATAGGEAAAAAALVAFAAGTAVSMAALSSGLGYVLARASVRHRYRALAPLLGAVSFAFGAWYLAAAL
jgi:high-affinity nickel permease